MELREPERTTALLRDVLPNYCNVCKAMLAEAIRFWASDLRSRGRTLTGVHHWTGKEIRLAVAAGCPICVMIVEQMKFQKEELRYFGGRDDGPLFAYEIFKYFRILTQYHANTHCDVEGLIFACITREESDEKFWTSLLKHRNLECESTGDLAVLDRAKSWLYDCLEGHPVCATNESHYYPPRLLMLDGGSVRLLETRQSALSGAYATLSYSWGRNPRHLILTCDNAAVLNRGIRASKLSRTFREAIQVAQHLDIRLLWIDSLCILQSGTGHEADWQKHLSEMSEIYSNCVLNLAADHNESAEDGCFVVRDPDSIKPCLVYAEDSWLESADNERQSFRCEVLHDFDSWQRTIGRSPLSKRGWVFQERLLSPRILHFGSRQIFWECGQNFASETCPSGWPEDMRRVPFSIEEDHELTFIWEETVESYSHTQLTRPQDKLPALAGLAERFFKPKRIGYIAGMREDRLIMSLLWYTAEAQSAMVRAREAYRAPSWTWVSSDQPIRFVRSDNNYWIEWLAIITDIDLTYVDPHNCFGQIIGGSLTLLAVAWEAEFNTPAAFNYRRNRGLPNGARLLDENKQTLLDDHMDVFHIRLDEVLLGDGPWTFSLPILGVRSRLYGLVLAQQKTSSGQPCWKRVGMFDLNFSIRAFVRDFKDCNKTRFTII